MFVKLNRRRKDNATMLTKTASKCSVSQQQLIILHHNLSVSFCKYSLLENLTSSKNKTTTKISTTDDTLFASQCALAAAMPRGVLYLTQRFEQQISSTFKTMTHYSTHTHTKPEQFKVQKNKNRREQNWIRVDIVYYLCAFYDM